MLLSNQSIWRCSVLAGITYCLFLALLFSVWIESLQNSPDSQNRLTPVEREDATGVKDVNHNLGNRKPQLSLHESSNLPAIFPPADEPIRLDTFDPILKRSGRYINSPDILLFTLYFGTTQTARFHTRTPGGTLAEPGTISPTAGSYIVSNPITLTWQAVAEPGPHAKVHYDIYLGTSPDPELFKSNQDSTSLDIGELSAATTYYWRVVAQNRSGGDKQSSPVASFTTLSADHQFFDKIISEDTTLVADKGPYIIHGTLRIDEGTLTIQPGTVLKMAIDATIEVHGGFRAIGTASEPIVFTSLENDTLFGDTNNNGRQTEPEEGDWRTITFLKEATDSRAELAHCIVEYGGRSGETSIYIREASPIVRNTTVRYGEENGVEIAWGGKPEIRDCAIYDNKKNGINVFKSSPKITNTSFLNNGGYNIQIDEGSPVIDKCTIAKGGFGGLYLRRGSPTISANTLLGSSPLVFGADALGSATLKENNLPEKENIIIKAEIIKHDATWPLLPSRYQITGSTAVSGTDGEDGVTSLSLESGVSLLFDGDGCLQIGSSSRDPGVLIAIGSKERPITFTSSSPEPKASSWYGLQFRGTSAAGKSKLDHCIVEYAGKQNYGGIDIREASPTIAHTTARYNNSAGMKIDAGSSALSNVHLHDNHGDGLEIGSGTPTITNSFIVDNDRYGIHIKNGSPTIEFSAITGNKSGGVQGPREAQAPTIASNNWWGQASGPKDASDDTTKGGAFNPQGRGQSVSDKVLYKPWLSIPPEGIKE